MKICVVDQRECKGICPESRDKRGTERKCPALTEGDKKDLAGRRSV